MWEMLRIIVLYMVKLHCNGTEPITTDHVTEQSLFGGGSVFVYTMSQVQICVCAEICLWQM